MAKPMIKAPMKGMPMPMGKRPPPPPFPAPPMGKPPGFSGGTDNVNGGAHFSDKELAGPAYGWTGNASENNSVGLAMRAPEPGAGWEREMAQSIAMSREPYARTAVAPGQGNLYDPGRYHSAGVYDPRLMGTFIGHTVGPRAGPAPAMGPLSGMGDYPTAGPAGYAQGTPDVNTNGQGMQTRSGMGGSWNPQETPPPPPSPTPAGQNQSLRQSLGMGVKRFASGTPDVGDSGQGMAQGYAPQQGEYAPPPLDNHFVAHLRAAIGLAPKEQGFAGGTPNVGFDLGGAPGITNPTTVTPADRVISGQFGPFSWGQQAVANKTGAPANPGGQPGGTVPDNPNDFTTRAYDQQIDPTGGGAPANPQGQPGGSLPGRPALGGGFQQAGANDPMFGSLLQSMVSAPSTRTEHNKPISDPPLVHTTAKAADVTAGQAYAFTHPHEHTRDEFIQAVSDLPWGKAKALWGMQHYLTPQQKGAAQYLAANNQAVENDQKLAAAADTGTKKQQDDAAAQLAKDIANREGSTRKVFEGQSYITPDNTGQ